MLRILRVLCVALLATTSAAAVEVVVTFTGEVEFNQIGAAPLSGAINGDPAVLSFSIDSDAFVNNMAFPTRGYPILPGTFLLSYGSVSVGLDDPLTPAYFVIRNNDPGVDGFFFSTDLSFPIGVPLDVTGAFGQFANNTSVTYDGATLPSLDVLDAVGLYDFTGLQVFNWVINDGPFDAMGLIFATLTIDVMASGPMILRGDGNGDNAIGLPDALTLLNFGFIPGTPEPPCVAALDYDGNETVTALLDGLYLLNFLFLSGPIIPAPYPDCGTDPSGLADTDCATPTCP